MEDPLAAIRTTFFQECDEQLAELESGLIAMESGAADTETVNAVFRAVHSIKGGAGIFALDTLVRFAHIFETALDGVRSGTLVATPPVVAIFLRAADLLADLVRAARENEASDETRIATLVADFNRISASEAVASIVTNAGLHSSPYHHKKIENATVITWNITFTPHLALYAKANETALLLRELQRLGKVEVVIDQSHLPDLQMLDPEGAFLSWKIRLVSNCKREDILNVFEFVEDDCELDISAMESKGFEPGLVLTGENGFKFEFFTPIEDGDADHHEPETIQITEPKIEIKSPDGRQGIPSQVAQVVVPKNELTNAIGATIRVDLDRVDRMIDLVGELVINEAMLSQRVLEAGIARSSGIAMALEELENLTREIQDSVMAIRAQPVRSVFQRMPRLVREVAAMTNKQVRLVTEGESTEVDKTVIERISDPLTHMIRNAIDHGLESTEARLAAG